MAKKVKKAEVEETTQEQERAIIKAELKDEHCNFTYTVLNGKLKGAEHKVKGPGIVDEDLKVSMGMLDVHLAFFDEAFDLSKISVEKIGKFHSHDLTRRYSVYGFEVSGEDEEISVVLKGTKQSKYAPSDTMDIKTPKIALHDGSAFYPFRSELHAALDMLREEVELYSEGKFTRPEDDPKQVKLNFEDENNEEIESGRID